MCKGFEELVMNYWFQYKLKLDKIDTKYRYRFENNTFCKRKDQAHTSGIDILTVEG